jgi:phage shock protein A/DNA-binding XRE family transcriptional regulator
MGYQLRMHREIRDWLTGLRRTEPELARLVGEAVLALLDAGETLGPPLVVPLGSALGPPDDPRHTLDYAYQRQLEMLNQVRRGVADVATSRKRIELTVGHLEQQAATLAGQRGHALDTGHDDVAREAGSREAGIQARLSQLRRQLDTLAGDEERLTTASQRLQARVELFRVEKETIKASYTAAEATRMAQEALAGIGVDVSDLQSVAAEADATSGSAGTATAADELLLEIGDLTPQPGGLPGLPGEDEVRLPPGVMELRPGAPGDVRSGLLFVVQPPDTVVLVGQVDDPGGSPGDYREVLGLVTSRLAVGQPAGPSGDTASGAAFVSYDADTFLDEFFAGAETEVEIGAGALVARNRAHTLAEARQRMRLTQAQVADRMNVRQERVSAIERAEPGATEVRTLAAYVRALGGRLEIVADIGGERIMLR